MGKVRIEERRKLLGTKLFVNLTCIYSEVYWRNIIYAE